MALSRSTVETNFVHPTWARVRSIERIGNKELGLDVGIEAVQSGNMPLWARSSAAFWRKLDQAPGIDGREIQLTILPGFSAAQRFALVQEFVLQELGGRYTYTFAIRNRKMQDGGEQPHACIVFCLRINDGIIRSTAQHYFKRYSSKAPQQGGCKKANQTICCGERNVDAIARRQRWTELQAKHLAMHQNPDRTLHHKKESACPCAYMPPVRAAFPFLEHVKPVRCPAGKEA